MVKDLRVSMLFASLAALFVLTVPSGQFMKGPLDGLTVDGRYIAGDQTDVVRRAFVQKVSNAGGKTWGDKNAVLMRIAGHYDYDPSGEPWRVRVIVDSSDGKMHSVGEAACPDACRAWSGARYAELADRATAQAVAGLTKQYAMSTGRMIVPR